MRIAVAKGTFLPVPGLPRNDPMIPAKIVIRGIAEVDAGKVGLRTEFAVGKKYFPGVEGAVVGIERVVAGIANERYSRPPNPHWLREQGDLRQADLQGAGIHGNPAVREGIDQGNGFVHALRNAKRPGKNRGLVGADHGAVVIATGEGQVERWFIPKMRILITEHGNLLQRSIVGTQGNGLVGAPQVGAAYIK